jgi:hypothetical protein
MGPKGCAFIQTVFTAFNFAYQEVFDLTYYFNCVKNISLKLKRIYTVVGRYIQFPAQFIYKFSAKCEKLSF